MKGTARVLEAIKELDSCSGQIEFRFIEGLSHAQYLDELRHIDVLIDQLDAPMPGMAALEAMAAGKVVITGNLESAHGFFPFLAQNPGFHGSSEAGALEALLCRIVAMRGSLESLGYRGREYVDRNHSHVVVAGKFIEVWSESSSKDHYAV
ncbi:MAG: glycosyltransferase [Acidiferrobacter sp.]